MTSLQEVMKWSHEGFRYFLITLVEDIVLYTSKSPLEAPLIL